MNKWITSFLLITIGLLCFTGIYIWITTKDQVATLSYVADPNWSKQRPIAKEIRGSYFKTTMDEKQQIHSIWVEFIPPYGTSELKYSSINSKGKTIHDTKVLLTNERITDITLTALDEHIHIFWVGQSNDKHNHLYYTLLNQQGQIVSTQQLLSNEFEQVKDLQVITSKTQSSLLVWTDLVNNVRQIKTLYIDSTQQIPQKSLQITSSNDHSTVPKIIIDEQNQYHLAWNEKTKNSYQLYYQPLNDKGEPIKAPLYISEISQKPTSLLVKDKTLYLIWSRYVRSTENPVNFVSKRGKNYELFATKINLEQQPEQLNIKRLTYKDSPTIEPNISMNQSGNLQLIFIELWEYPTLTHWVLTDDFQTEKKSQRRIYPEQLTAFNTHLFTDANHNLHLVWAENGNFGINYYYANTQHPQWISPFKIIGLNSDMPQANLIITFLHYITCTYANIVAGEHLFIIVICIIIVGALRLFLRGTKLGAYFNNFTISSLLVTALYIIIYFGFGRKILFFTPFIPGKTQMWFSFILGSMGVVTYLILNKKDKFKIYQTGLITLSWIFWVYITHLTFYIPVYKLYYIQ